MAKKNPYVFTIGFDETDLSHVRAAEILNSTKKKAQLIAAAILSYVDGKDMERTADPSLEAFRPLLEKLIQEEVGKALKNQIPSENRREEDQEKVMDLTKNEAVPMDDNLTRSITDAMDLFRRN